MRGSRFSDEQIIGVLREADAGAATTELCRHHGISPATFYNWKARFGGKVLYLLAHPNREPGRVGATRHPPASHCCQSGSQPVPVP
jgi:putative transposase